MNQANSELATQIVSDDSFQSRFSLIRPLGDGAAGIVLLVKDSNRNGEKVALKILTNELAFDTHTADRFFEEIRVAKSIHHPNLVQAYDLVQIGRFYGYTMEYVEGCDLADIFALRRITFGEIDRFFVQALSALRVIHERGIVHRDLKLENILIRSDGVVKVSDLGLMKRMDIEKGYTQTGVLLGTAQYMPPEYIKRSEYDARGDIYACGVMLYELLSGLRRLSDLKGMEAIEYLIRSRFKVPDLDDHSCPEKYRFIVGKAMSPKPKDRFQSAEEMREAFLKDETQFDSAATRVFLKNRDRATVRSIAERIRGNLPSVRPVLGFVGIIAVAVLVLSQLPHQDLSLKNIPYGTYKGTIHLFGNTGFYKQASLRIEKLDTFWSSDAEQCKNGRVNRETGVVLCGDTRGRINLSAFTDGKVEGVFHDAENKTHPIVLTQNTGP